MKRTLTSIVGLVILIAFVIVLGSISIYYTPKEYIVTITDKHIKNYSDGSKILVFTEDESGETRVFSIEDSFITFRFNSADDYGDIEVGKTYKVEVIGWRIPFLSKYENIMDFNEVSQ